MMSYLLHDEDGQVTEAHSISAGLDYPGVGCEHSHLRETGRAKYVPVTDAQAMEGFKLLSQLEGIIPALETAHAIAHVMEMAPTMKKDETILVCLSGRGDKDVNQVADIMGVSL
jgi:tryptophan synthase beta chain